jgi:hypothetical protein
LNLLFKIVKKNTKKGFKLEEMNHLTPEQQQRMMMFMTASAQMTPEMQAKMMQGGMRQPMMGGMMYPGMHPGMAGVPGGMQQPVLQQPQQPIQPTQPPPPPKKERTIVKLSNDER